MKNKINVKNEVVETVLQEFHRRQAARRPFEITWQINMNFLMGNQYCNVGYGGNIEESDKQYFWQEREIFNHIAPIFDVRTAKLSKIKPKFGVLPATGDERDKQTAKVAKKIIESVYNKLDINTKINQAIKWSEVCGTVFYKLVWNAKTGQLLATDEDGNETRSGEVDLAICSPYEIFPDSATCESIQDCQSIIHARAYSVAEIKSMYGIDVKGGRVNCYSLDSVASGIGGLGYAGTATKVAETMKEDSALVIEYYVRPNSEYPQGRLVIVAGEELVYDDVLPYCIGEDGKRDFPFIRQVSLEQPGCFWGTSVIERLIPVQRAYNAVKNRKHEFINRLSLGVLSVEDGSVDLDNLEEEGLCPGKVLVYRQGSVEPRYLETESIPAGIADEEQKLLDEFSKISGVSETLGTEFVNANMSGTALELMIGQDEVRLNTTTESIRTASQFIATYILRLYKQFALFPRLARIIGENGQIEMFYFTSSDISSDDVILQPQTDMHDSVAQRRQMVFDLLSAGVLYDDSGKLSNRMKGKILDMLGFGVWENAQDLNELQTKRAANENLKMLDGVNLQVSEIDDHALHVNEHIAFMLSADFGQTRLKNPAMETNFLQHIRQHKMNLKSEA